MRDIYLFAAGALTGAVLLAAGELFILWLVGREWDRDVDSIEIAVPRRAEVA